MEIVNELKQLNSKMRTKEDVSVSGILDSILWNTIHLDTEDRLKNLMEKIFKIYS